MVAGHWHDRSLLCAPQVDDLHVIRQAECVGRAQRAVAMVVVVEDDEAALGSAPATRGEGMIVPVVEGAEEQGGGRGEGQAGCGGGRGAAKGGSKSVLSRRQEGVTAV